MARGLIFLQGGLWLCFFFLSFSFQHYHHPEQRPIILFVALMLLLSVLSLVACFVLKKSKLPLLWVLGSAFLFRLLLVFSNPVQEDDFYRYLWDGAVLSRGINPYRYSPSEIKASDDKMLRATMRERLKEIRVFPGASAGEMMAELDNLRILSKELRLNELYYGRSWNPENDPDKENIPVFKRINHPDYVTVYPPLAQGVFSLSAFLKPGSLWTLRGLFVFVEMLTLGFIVKSLKKMNRDVRLCSFYAWNPLVIKEYINSPHLDVLLTCALSAFLFFSLSGNLYRAGLCLALAFLAKIFAGLALLFFLVVHGRKALKPLLVVLCVVLGGYSLFFSAGWRQFESLKIMSTHFVMNTPLPKLLKPLLWEGDRLFQQDPLEMKKVFTTRSLLLPDENLGRQLLWKRQAGITLQIMSLCWIFFCLFKIRKEKREKGFLFLAWGFAGAFLLMPVVNPWYFAVVMLLMPFAFDGALWGMGACLFLYYLRFYFLYRDESGAFQQVLFAEWMLLATCLCYALFRKAPSRSASTS
jgi:hypothetical protein